MLRKRVARGALAVGCTLVAAALGGGTASAADRAFERVTPTDNRAEIETNGGFTSASGDLVVFGSTGALVGAEPNGPYPAMDSYTSRRGASGWATEWTTDSTDVPGTYGSRTIFSTDDGLRQVMQTENSIDADDTFVHSMDPYLRVRGPDGGRTMTWLAPGPRPITQGRYAVASTPDLGAILIETTVAMDPQDVNGRQDLYLYKDGVWRIVTPGTSPSPGGDVGGAFGNLTVPGTLAADASYVYFVSYSRLVAEDTNNTRDIYRWNASDGSYELISVNRRTRAPSAPADVTLLGASEDGDVVCFTTATALVDGDDDNVGTDVYCYTRSTDTLEWVSSADVSLYNNVPLGAEALAMSADGSSIFFSTILPLTAEDTDDDVSLYVRRDGVTRYISLLSSDDINPRRAASTDAHQRALHVTADGTAAVFTTEAQAISATDRDTAPDVYRWSIDKGLEHVSIGDGPGDSVSGAAPSSADLIMSRDAITGRVMNEDASVVFFESRASLVPQDTDGGFIDVYEWHADGTVRLVSPEGDARYDALYMDSAADGSTVFIVTAEPIHPNDINAVRDLYAARIGGGFSAPPPPPDPCKGEACQGIVTSPPLFQPPATRGFDGPGDTEDPAPVEARQRLLKLTAKERRGLARRGRVSVRVTVSEPGMLIVTASARVGGRTVRVARSSATVGKKGTVRIPLALSKAARTQLRRQRRLRVTFTSTYSKTDEPVSRAVTLRG